MFGLIMMFFDEGDASLVVLLVLAVADYGDLTMQISAKDKDRERKTTCSRKQLIMSMNV